MGQRRPDLFRPDRGLQVRMVVAALVTPLVVLGSIAAVIILASEEVVIGFLIAVTVGIVAGAHDARHRTAKGRPVSVERAPHLHATVERLCVLADLPKPEIVIAPDEQPNSWTVGLSPRRTRLYVTAGLLALLSQSELEAVIAHELAHIAHHDAAVMSVVGGPGAVLFDGARRIFASDWWLCLWSGLLAAGAIGWLSRLATLSLSRRRELAADASAAMLTGRPMALACALRRVGGQLAMLPSDDLRAAASRDMFHLLPVEARGMLYGGGSTATHPSLIERVERLERLEWQMHRHGLGWGREPLARAAGR
jgi:heat shock protein HtpX